MWTLELSVRSGKNMVLCSEQYPKMLDFLSMEIATEICIRGMEVSIFVKWLWRMQIGSGSGRWEWDAIGALEHVRKRLLKFKFMHGVLGLKGNTLHCKLHFLIVRNPPSTEHFFCSGGGLSAGVCAPPLSVTHCPCCVLVYLLYVRASSGPSLHLNYHRHAFPLRSRPELLCGLSEKMCSVHATDTRSF